MQSFFGIVLGFGIGMLVGMGLRMSVKQFFEPNTGVELLVPQDDLNCADEGIVPSGCTFRYCHAELEVTGRLKGTPTLELLAAWSRLVTSTASYGMGSAFRPTRTRAPCAHQPHVATVEFG